MEFTVAHPQLEHRRGDFRAGVKRYHLQKNTNSPDFVMGSPQHQSTTYLARRLSGNLQSEAHLPNREMGFPRYRTPSSREAQACLGFSKTSRFIPTDRNHNPLLSQYGHHPLFRQPRFTKLSPKIQPTSPITGLSPHTKRVMATYGGLLVKPS